MYVVVCAEVCACLSVLTSKLGRLPPVALPSLLLPVLTSVLAPLLAPLSMCLLSLLVLDLM